MKGILYLTVTILCLHNVKAGEVPEEIKHLVVGLREKCHRETGVDIEHVDRTVEGYFHPSETLGCYFSCLFNSFDLLDHDGHLDWDKAISKLDAVGSLRDHAMDFINACRGTTGANPCESALNIVQCFQKAYPDKFFVI
uniref:Pheromone-binding protein n=1 Tax=Trichogramma chilonis TaxID=53598 RepID=A0A977TQ95_9HYME|nr:pheromone-binding protein [Trichogramma chilonis]